MVALASAAFFNNAFAQPAAVPGLTALVEGGQRDQGGERSVLPSERYKVEVDLSAVTHDLGAVDLPAAKPSRPLQVGINRSADVSHDARAQRIRNADGTQITVVAIKSPEAVALRLRFTGFDLRPGDEVYVRGVTDGSAVAGPYTGKGAWGDGEFWSAMIEGDTAIIEHHAKSDEGSFVVSEVSHIYRRVGQENAEPEVLACEVDASCSSVGAKNAVGRITFVSEGASYVCTGTMLNNSNNDRAPYFLTANHCIATQAEARSIEAYWLYQTTSCNSNVLRGDWTRTSGGADLLATSANDDSTLVRFLAPAPAVVAFSGWSPTPVGVNSSVFGLHHPGGATPPILESYLRRSMGWISSANGSCLSSGYEVDWTSGTTEPGSSGSGLFVENGGSPYLIGTLSCGSVTGTCAGSYDAYGKFANFYPQVAPYLNPEPPVDLAVALDAPGLAWPTGGSSLWVGQRTTTRDGVDAGKSGLISHGHESWVQTTVIGPGTLTFWWKVSSEPSFDVLKFQLSGSEVSAAPRISGTVDWQHRTVSIPPGSHWLRWTYSKDGSVSLGADAGWLDQVSFVAGGKTDFNGDGFGDFVWQNTRTGERMMWFLSNGLYVNGHYFQTIAPEWRIAGTGDLNADGHGDFTWQNIVTGEHVVWFLRHGQYQSGFYFDTLPVEWQIASSADLNGDRHADFVWQNTRTGEHVVWFLRHGRYQSGFYFDTIPPEWQIASAADFNADGHADFVWQNTRTGEHVYWFLRDGRFQSGFYFETLAPEWRIAGATDLNNDAHADMLWQNINTGDRVVWFLRDGLYQRGFYMQPVNRDWDLCVR